MKKIGQWVVLDSDLTSEPSLLELELESWRCRAHVLRQKKAGRDASVAGLMVAAEDDGGGVDGEDCN